MASVSGSTVLWTVFSGTAVYVLGQILVRFLIEPIQEMRRTIAAVAQGLVELSDVYTNPGLHQEQPGLAERYPDTRQHFRQLMAQLESATYQIPQYPTVAKTLKLPSQQQVDDAVRGLTGIQNSLWSKDGAIENVKRAQRIRDALGIRTHPADRVNPD